MIDFSDSQSKTIASALTALAIAVVVGFAVSAGWIVVKALGVLAPAVVPLVMGMFLAMFFKPYYSLWLKLVKNPTLAVALMLASVLVPVSLGIWYFGSVAATQVAGLVESAPERAAKVTQWFNDAFPNAKPLADKLEIPYDTWADSIKEAFVRFSMGFVGYMTSILNWLVSLVFFVYFVTRPALTGESWVKEMPFLKEDTRRFVATHIDAFFDIIVSFFQRQVVICLLEGVYYGLGFMLVQVPYGFLVGFALGVLNLVPLFGTVLCLPIALPLAYWGVDGSTAKLVMTLVVWLVGQVMDGYLITPKIQGNKTGLGYAGVIFSFFFWGAVFNSFLGLLLAIPLSAFWVVLWRALKSKYIKPVV